jgi:peptidoglycan/LPS O-acetylase OafA/YrhL
VKRARRLRVAVVTLGAVAAVVLVLMLVRLWQSANGNVAGWITTFVVFGAIWLGAEVLGLDRAFVRASSRTRWLVVTAGLALALGGGIVYVLWPGTASWYLAYLPSIPVTLLVIWSAQDENAEPGPPSYTDGPWGAP